MTRFKSRSKGEPMDYAVFPEYQEGHQSFRFKSTTSTPCPNGPYKEGPQKTAWLVGWLDARTETTLGEKKRKRLSKKQGSKQ